MERVDLSTGSAAMAAGVAARANSAGVTWLTFLSVVWAEHDRDSKVNGSRVAERDVERGVELVQDLEDTARFVSLRHVWRGRKFQGRGKPGTRGGWPGSLRRQPLKGTPACG